MTSTTNNKASMCREKKVALGGNSHMYRQSLQALLGSVLPAGAVKPRILLILNSANHHTTVLPHCSVLITKKLADC